MALDTHEQPLKQRHADSLWVGRQVWHSRSAITDRVARGIRAISCTCSMELRHWRSRFCPPARCRAYAYGRRRQ